MEEIKRKERIGKKRKKNRMRKKEKGYARKRQKRNDFQAKKWR